MSQFKIYRGEIGLQSENAQLKAELAALRADNNRLRSLVGEAPLETAPLQGDAFARQTSNGSTIGTLKEVAQGNRPAAIVAVMGSPAPAGGQAFETGDGCKVTIGAPSGGLPQLNPTIAAARAGRPQRLGLPQPTPIEPEIAVLSNPPKQAQEEVDEDDAVQRFSQLEF